MATESDKPRAASGRPAWSAERARELGRRGGRAKAHKWKLMDSLGLLAVARDSKFAPYRDAGEALLKAQSSELAKHCGGSLGPGPSSLLSTWALQMAASRFLFDKGLSGEGDVDLIESASRIANHARTALLAAEALSRDTVDRIELAEELRRKAKEQGPERAAADGEKALPPWMVEDAPA